MDVGACTDERATALECFLRAAGEPEHSIVGLDVVATHLARCGWVFHGDHPYSAFSSELVTLLANTLPAVWDGGDWESDLIDALRQDTRFIVADTPDQYFGGHCVVLDVQEVATRGQEALLAAAELLWPPEQDCLCWARYATVDHLLKLQVQLLLDDSTDDFLAFTDDMSAAEAAVRRAWCEMYADADEPFRNLAEVLEAQPSFLLSRQTVYHKRYTHVALDPDALTAAAAAATMGAAEPMTAPPLPAAGLLGRCGVNAVPFVPNAASASTFKPWAVHAAPFVPNTAHAPPPVPDTALARPLTPDAVLAAPFAPKGVSAGVPVQPETISGTPLADIAAAAAAAARSFAAQAAAFRVFGADNEEHSVCHRIVAHLAGAGDVAVQLAALCRSVGTSEPYAAHLVTQRYPSFFACTFGSGGVLTAVRLNLPVLWRAAEEAPKAPTVVTAAVAPSEGESGQQHWGAVPGATCSTQRPKQEKRQAVTPATAAHPAGGLLRTREGWARIARAVWPSSDPTHKACCAMAMALGMNNDMALPLERLEVVAARCLGSITAADLASCLDHRFFEVFEAEGRRFVRLHWVQLQQAAEAAEDVGDCPPMGGTSSPVTVPVVANFASGGPLSDQSSALHDMDAPPSFSSSCHPESGALAGRAERAAVPDTVTAAEAAQHQALLQTLDEMEAEGKQIGPDLAAALVKMIFSGPRAVVTQLLALEVVHAPDMLAKTERLKALLVGVHKAPTVEQALDGRYFSHCQGHVGIRIHSLKEALQRRVEAMHQAWPAHPDKVSNALPGPLAAAPLSPGRQPATPAARTDVSSGSIGSGGSGGSGGIRRDDAITGACCPAAAMAVAPATADRAGAPTSVPSWRGQLVYGTPAAAAVLALAAKGAWPSLPKAEQRALEATVAVLAQQPNYQAATGEIGAQVPRQGVTKKLSKLLCVPQLEVDRTGVSSHIVRLLPGALLLLEDAAALDPAAVAATRLWGSSGAVDRMQCAVAEALALAPSRTLALHELERGLALAGSWRALASHLSAEFFQLLDPPGQGTDPAKLGGHPTHVRLLVGPLLAAAGAVPQAPQEGAMGQALGAALAAACKAPSPWRRAGGAAGSNGHMQAECKDAANSHVEGGRASTWGQPPPARAATASTAAAGGSRPQSAATGRVDHADGVSSTLITPDVTCAVPVPLAPPPGESPWAGVSQASVPPQCGGAQPVDDAALAATQQIGVEGHSASCDESTSSPSTAMPCTPASGVGSAAAPAAGRSSQLPLAPLALLQPSSPLSASSSSIASLEAAAAGSLDSEALRLGVPEASTAAAGSAPSTSGAAAPAGRGGAPSPTSLPPGDFAASAAVGTLPLAGAPSAGPDAMRAHLLTSSAAGVPPGAAAHAPAAMPETAAPLAQATPPPAVLGPGRDYELAFGRDHRASVRASSSCTGMGGGAVPTGGGAVPTGDAHSRTQGSPRDLRTAPLRPPWVEEQADAVARVVSALPARLHSYLTPYTKRGADPALAGLFLDDGRDAILRLSDGSIVRLLGVRIAMAEALQSLNSDLANGISRSTDGGGPTSGSSARAAGPWHAPPGAAAAILTCPHGGGGSHDSGAATLSPPDGIHHASGASTSTPHHCATARLQEPAPPAAPPGVSSVQMPLQQHQAISELATLGRTFAGRASLALPGSLSRVAAMRGMEGEVCGLTFHVGFQVRGAAQPLMDLLSQISRHAAGRAGPGVQLAPHHRSLLLVGPCGAGKTTLLREAARVLADDFKRAVLIVDTNNEIAGHASTPHASIGSARCVMVPDRLLLAKVMLQAARDHVPDIIVVDDIASQQEAAAATTLCLAGCSVVAAAYAPDLARLLSVPELGDLFGGKCSCSELTAHAATSCIIGLARSAAANGVGVGAGANSMPSSLAATSAPMPVPTSPASVRRGVAARPTLASTFSHTSTTTEPFAASATPLANTVLSPEMFGTESCGESAQPLWPVPGSVAFSGFTGIVEVLGHDRLRVHQDAAESVHILRKQQQPHSELRWWGASGQLMVRFSTAVAAQRHQLRGGVEAL